MKYESAVLVLGKCFLISAVRGLMLSSFSLYSSSERSSSRTKPLCSKNQASTSSYGSSSVSLVSFSIFGKCIKNRFLVASPISSLATYAAPSCSPSYTNSTFPVIAGIIPIKSPKRIDVCVSPLISIRRSAVLMRFSKAVILIRALIPLFSSINSLSRAAKLISSNKSRTKSGTCTFSF